MLIYFITIGLILLLCLLFSLVSPKREAEEIIDPKTSIKLNIKRTVEEKIVFFLIFFVLSFVASFRYMVGTDFHAYFRTKIWSRNFLVGNFGDPGFTIFAMFADFVFQGRNGGLTILSATITTALFVYTIFKRSDNITVSLLLFIFVGCFTGMFNGVRQYLATAILFAGFHFVYEKKFVKWLMVVLLASSIHITAILMLFVYFICNIKCNLKTVAVYFLVAIIMLYLYEPLFNLVGALKQEEINTNISSFTRHVNILRVLVQCVPLIMFFFVGRQSINEDCECKVIFNVCLLNAAIAIASMNSVYFSRFYIYTMCFQVLMYPKIFSKLTKYDRYIFTALLLTFYGLFWLYEVSNSSSLNEFKWIFNYLK